jgi:hypothetical protein
MLYILRQYLLKPLSNKNKLAEVLPKATLIYRQKLYLELINKADTKPVIINIAVISAVDTHFYI